MNIDTLIFAEKPSQGREYANAFSIKNREKSYIELNPCQTFPNGAVITWGIGHLVQMKMPPEYDERYKRWNLDNLPIVPDEFEYRWMDSKDLKSHIKEVSRLLKDSKELLIGTDVDREGELIARLVFNQAGVSNKPVKRLWINSLMPDEIRKGFKQLKEGSETYDLYLEAQARQQADWLVGMNLSPLYSLLLQQKGFKGSLSIGRVQTPTVKIIYDRQKEIENFVSNPFYELKSTFTAEDGEYEGISNIKVDTKDEMREVLEKYGLEREDVGVVKSVTKKEKRNLAPQLHSISSLQTKANKLWKYSPDDVLKTVQSLYEKKIVTYPRTDCKFITEAEFSYLVSNVEQYKDVAGVDFETHSTASSKRFVDNKKVKEHYAIIPTQKIPTQNELDKLSSMEKDVYNEILVSTLGMFHRDYVYEETEIITDVKGLEFKTKGRIEKDRGWRDISLDVRRTRDKTLPDVAENEQVDAELKIEEGKTSPPKPYTEGQLIRLMETAGRLVEEDDGEELEQIDGIGTGATRANVIERIKQQGYIVIKKNIVEVTKKGEILCEAVDGTLLASPTMTAKWETYLKKIGQGEGSKDLFLDNIVKFIDKMIEEVPTQLGAGVIELVEQEVESSSVAKCPSCEGYINDRGKFYGCTGYSNGCRVTFPKKLAGKNLTKSIVKTLCTKGSTNKLKGFKSKSGNSFETKLVLDDEYKIKFDFN